MKCQRCIEGKEVRYRVYSDVMDLKVCPSCATEAQGLRLTIELLHPDEVRRNGFEDGSSSGTFFQVSSAAT